MGNPERKCSVLTTVCLNCYSSAYFCYFQTLELGAYPCSWRNNISQWTLQWPVCSKDGTNNTFPIHKRQSDGQTLWPLCPTEHSRGNAVPPIVVLNRSRNFHFLLCGSQAPWKRYGDLKTTNPWVVQAPLTGPEGWGCHMEREKKGAAPSSSSQVEQRRTIPDKPLKYSRHTNSWVLSHYWLVEVPVTQQ